jgi:hypothetical protein
MTRDTDSAPDLLALIALVLLLTLLGSIGPVWQGWSPTSAGSSQEPDGPRWSVVDAGPSV